MSLRGIQNAAHSMAYYARMQEVTANNLANVSTDAFKMDRLTGQLSADGTWPVPVEHTDLRQGTLRQTGRALDVGLEGDGFLVVRTPQGERLSRGGALRLDADGRLTDGANNPILGERGPIVVPTTGQVTIQEDGRVLVDGTELDRLRQETVADPATLRKEGHGLFVAQGATTRVAEGALRVHQGSVEEPNGDAVLGMVDLVTIQRAYSANADALKALDGVLGSITTEIGKV